MEKKNPVFIVIPIQFYEYDLTGTRKANVSQNRRQCAIKEKG